MPYLDIPGGKLYYETQGKGRLLVLVPAANGDTKLYEPILPYLAEKFTVCAYDRRRFSRSVQTEDNDYQGAERLARDADDLELLVKHLQPDKPALIFGSSSGGSVSLEYMRRHAGSVAGMIAHETPLPAILDPSIAQAFGQQVFGVYSEYEQQKDPKIVRDWFMSIFPNEEDRDCLTKYWDQPETQGNLKFWIERELMGYAGLGVDFDVLKKNNDRLVIAYSTAMEEGFVGMAAKALAEKTEAPLVVIPHAHMGYSTHPKEFAAAITKEFESRWD